MPYARDGKRLARSWALPGTKGVEHRIGGLEKDYLKGSISYNPTNHQKMVDIRAAKVTRVADYIPRQETIGPHHGDLLVVGWGGTRGHLYSAVKRLQDEGKAVSLCHFNFLHPLPHGVREIFSRFRKIVVCELNSGQLAQYLRMSEPEFCYEQYNKVTGQPFTVTELIKAFHRLLNEPNHE